MARSINPTPQYFDNGGKPLSGGQMYYFIGGTTTPLTTYADVNQTIANPHPVILDGAGRLPNVFFDGTARQVLEDANGVQIWEREPVESSAGNGGSFVDYDAQTIYSENDVVIATDGNYYRSLTNGNQNNTPQSSPTEWNKVQFLEDWNANITYGSGDDVRTTDGKIYRSLVASNLNNNPSISPVEWRDLEGAGIQIWDTGISYALDDHVIRNGILYKAISANSGFDPELFPNRWRAYEARARGTILNPGNVFDGFGVTSVTNSATGVHDVVFSGSASATGSQITLATNGGNTNIVMSAQATSATATTIRGWESSTATLTNQYPIQVESWYVN